MKIIDNAKYAGPGSSKGDLKAKELYDNNYDGIFRKKPKKKKAKKNEKHNSTKG